MVDVVSRQCIEHVVGSVCGAAVALASFIGSKALNVFGLLPYGVLGGLWAANAAHRKLNRAQRQLVATTVGNLSYQTCTVLLPEPRDSWIRFMDPESVLWLSEMLKQIWPYFNQATHDAVAKHVAIALAENKHLNVEVKKLNFGDQPPLVTVSSSRDTSNKDEVLLDVGIKWASHPTIEVVAKVKGVPFWLSLKDFQLFGVLTLKLVLADKLPLVSLIVASFHKPPKVDFQLKAMGASLVNSGPDSGISGQIMKIVDNVVAKICVWPNQITVPLIGKMSDYPRRYVTPVGVLHVRLDRAELARGADFSLTGKASADPYARMELTSGDTKQSSVKPRTLAPQWNEYFEFQVCDPQVQSLRFQIMDKDRVMADDEMAVIQDGLNLEKLQLITMQSPLTQEFELTSNIKDGDVVLGGKVALSLFFLPYRMPGQELKPLPDTNTWGQSIEYGTFLQVIVHECTNLISAVKKPQYKTDTSDPYVIISLVDNTEQDQASIYQTHKTHKLKDSLNPSFEKVFLFTNLDMDRYSLHFEVRDGDKMVNENFSLIGRYSSKLAELLVPEDSPVKSEIMADYISIARYNQPLIGIPKELQKRKIPRAPPPKIRFTLKWAK